MGFRYWKSLGVSYERQGLAYFTSRTYRDQPKRVRDRIDYLCLECGGKYADALKTYVTTDAGIAAVCRRFFVSENTLRRAARRYYRAF
jgi:transposase-like protein